MFRQDFMSLAKKYILRVGAIFGTALFFLSSPNPSSADQNTHPNFEIHHKKNDRLPKLKTALPNYIQVFGLFIQATKRVPQSKLLHAANIAADFLDNNRDGIPDNKAINDELWKKKSAIVMAYNERELEKLHDQFKELFIDYSLQGLFATETLPEGGPHNQNSSKFDASIEEILHIITSVGYAGVYPKVFGEKKGSDLAKAMDKARGGYFRNVPRKYPSRAWYSYDDQTCDYGCQVTEYIYWAVTSLMNGQNFKGRKQNIQHEWKLNTPAKLRTNDKDVFNILTNPKYLIPLRLPDGKYSKNRKQTSSIRLNILETKDQLTINAFLSNESPLSLVPSKNKKINFPVKVELEQNKFSRL